MTEDRKPSLGEYLRSEREKRGLTIEQTSSATKIGLKILRQLEADKYSELPALPFVRGFVRNYGKFLGLDGEKLLRDYAGFLEEHSGERPKRDAGHSGYAFERPEGEQSRKVLWGVMAGMLIFGGAVVFLFKPSLKRKHHGAVEKLKAVPSAIPSALPSGVPSPVISGSPTPSGTPVATPSALPTPAPSATAGGAPFVPPKSPLVLVPSPLPVASPKGTPSPVVTPSPVTAAPSPVVTPSPTVAPTVIPTPAASLTPAEDLKQDPLQSGTNYPPKEVRYRMIFRAKADVWVRYRCDTKQVMKFVLKQGKILVLRGKQRVHFQTSNSESITMQINGGPEKFISNSPATFEYGGNSTVIWPLQARETAGENFPAGEPLPFTPGPELVN